VTLGVQGTLPAGSTTHLRGTSVSYSFSLRSGFQNLRITLNGVEAPPSGQLKLDADAALVAAADTIVRASPLADLLRATYRAMIVDGAEVASTFPRARELTAQLYATLPKEEAEFRSASALAEAFDPISDSAAYSRFTRSLSTLLERESAAPGSGAGSLTPVGIRAATTLQNSLGTAGEPRTWIIFVNGILQMPDDIEETVTNVFVPFVDRWLPDRNRYPTSVFRNYSHSWAWLVCLRRVNAALGAGRYTEALRGEDCVAKYLGAPVDGIREVMRQYLGTAATAANTEVVTALRDSLQARLRSNDRVVVIAHSQGNMIADLAFALLASDRTVDLKCAAFIGLAPPRVLPNVRSASYHQEFIIDDGPARDLLLRVVPGAEASGATRVSTPASRFWASQALVTESFPLFVGYYLHAAKRYFGAAREALPEALASSVEAVNRECGKAGAGLTTNATIEIRSNSSAGWTLEPNGLLGSGSRSVAVIASPAGSAFTLRPAPVEGAYVVTSPSDATVFLVPDQTKSISVSYYRDPVATPQVTAVEPSTPLASGVAQEFVIRGLNFAAGASVTLRELRSGRSFPERPIVALSTTSITLVTNFGSESGSWTVEVVNPGQTSSGQYTFPVSVTAGAPTITGVTSVTAGPFPQNVTIHGLNFGTSATVSLRNLSTGVQQTGIAPGQASLTQLTVSAAFPAPSSWAAQVVNPGGVRSAEYPFAVVATAIAPAAPTNLAAVVSGSSVSLAWARNSTNENGFKIERAIAPSGGFSEIGTTGPGVLAFLDQAVTVGTSYSYRVRAFNVVGNSDYSNSITALVSVTTPGPPTATTEAATNITQSGLRMNGTINPNGVSTSGYFESGTTPTLSSFNSSTPASLGSTTNVITISSNLGDLACGTTFYYRAVAQPAVGSIVRGSIASATTSACSGSTPTVLLTANPTSITAGQSSTLTWSSTNAALCAGGWASNGAGGQVATAGTATVSPAATITYAIVCSGSGTNPLTASATATITVNAPAVPAMPSNVSPGSTTSPGPTQSSSTVTISWSASSGATSYSFGIRDMGTNQLVVDVTNHSSTSYTANLSAGKQYRWNVSACNSAGCSSYTSQLYFQTPAAVTTPATPANPSPGSSSSPGPTTSSRTVTISWSASTGATSYSFGIRDIATNQLVVDVTNHTSTSHTASLTAGKQYRWNVSACNSAGCSSYTTPLYFRTP